MAEVLNVGLLGYGMAGQLFHAPIISAVPGLRLAWVGSTRPEKVQTDWPAVSVASVDEVLTRPDVDIVVIATPNDTHVDLARRALEAGKHVVVDKPFTNTLAEARAVAALAVKTGRRLSVYQSRRWDGDFQTVRRLIADGTLGRLVQFESHYDRYRPEVKQRWREEPGPGAGVWFDLGAHLVDQALQLFGVPEGIYADFAQQRDGAKVVDDFHVLLRYPRLRVILRGGVLVSEETPRFRVHGTSGSYLKFGLDTQEEALKRGERPGGADWGVDPREGTVVQWKDGRPESRTVPAMRGDYCGFYAGMRDAVLGRGPAPVTPEQAIAVMTALEVANESAATRRECRWPADAL
jgi:predicted dehydrogenase